MRQDAKASDADGGASWQRFGHMAMWKPEVKSDIHSAEVQWAYVLVHEFTHAFVARYRTNARIPRWLNEGIAEVIASIQYKTASVLPYAFARSEKLASIADVLADKGPLVPKTIALPRRSSNTSSITKAEPAFWPTSTTSKTASPRTPRWMLSSTATAAALRMAGANTSAAAQCGNDQTTHDTHARGLSRPCICHHINGVHVRELFNQK